MKVLMINGSPNEKGCTYTALSEVAKELNAAGVETEILHVGKEPIRGCTGCVQCRERGGRCIYGDDKVNYALDVMQESDGLVLGSPVHYAGASGYITSFLDRMYYTNGADFAYKPGAAIVTVRRGGATAAFEQLNKYITISQMMMVGSQYWNMVHGNTPEELANDLEGMQTMRVLGRNMAWLLQCIEAGKKAGVPLPEREQREFTNFVR